MAAPSTTGGLVSIAMEMAKRIDLMELAMKAWLDDRDEGNNNDDHHYREFRKFLSS